MINVGSLSDLLKAPVFRADQNDLELWKQDWVSNMQRKSWSQSWWICGQASDLPLSDSKVMFLGDFLRKIEMF